MTWSIPWRFVPGTKAKANEVNENFTSIKQFVDQLETNVANNEINIQQLNENKAYINGSNEQRFAVADAINDKDAMNKQSVNKTINNSIDIIRGLKLYKFNNTTIACESGSCYDSQKKTIIISDTSLNKQVDNLAANATYYCYITATESGSDNHQLVASLSPTAPELPIGHTIYRQLGHFTTNSSAIINKIFQVGDNNKAVVGFLNTARLLSSSGNYTPEEDCWLIAGASGRRCQLVVSVNDVQVYAQGPHWEGDDATSYSCMLPIMAGQKVSVGGSASWVKYYAML